MGYFNQINRCVSACLLFIVGVSFTVIFFEDHVMAKETRKVVSSATTFMLSEGEIKNLQYEVEHKNNLDAAFRLYLYYNFSRNDRENTLKYLLICSNGENIIAQLNLAVLYANNKQFDEARKWALRAKKNGSKNADSILEEIESIRRESTRR